MRQRAISSNNDLLLFSCYASSSDGGTYCTGNYIYYNDIGYITFSTATTTTTPFTITVSKPFKAKVYWNWASRGTYSRNGSVKLNGTAITANTELNLNTGDKIVVGTPAASSGASIGVTIVALS